jgi:cell division protein FtsZ
MPGLINLDFADVRSVMSEMGKAMMGTGEGEGENRALAAAEQAIANPLLDGVSMAGARGVIISIIGGEDMRLLEVDEAANHIRELVDEDANIIWGSAFNPDLKGKIRVSVVATGIEQSASGQVERSQPVSLGMSRAPKRPVLELSEDDGLTELPEEPVAAAPPLAAMVTVPVAAAGFTHTPPEAVKEEPEAEAEEDYNVAAPFDLSGMQAGDEMGDDYEDDVDGIVDPLAGLRSAEEDVATYQPEGDAEDTLDLTGDYADYEDLSAPAASDPRQPPKQDDLLASADRLAAEDQPVTARLGGGRRRGLVGGSEAESGATGGSTLFERMANLSRSTAREEEDKDEGEDGPALSIPRFLDRNRNQ